MKNRAVDVQSKENSEEGQISMKFISSGVNEITLTRSLQSRADSPRGRGSEWSKPL